MAPKNRLVYCVFSVHIFIALGLFAAKHCKKNVHLKNPIILFSHQSEKKIQENGGTNNVLEMNNKQAVIENTFMQNYPKILLLPKRGFSACSY